MQRRSSERGAALEGNVVKLKKGQKCRMSKDKNKQTNKQTWMFGYFRVPCSKCGQVVTLRESR